MILCNEGSHPSTTFQSRNRIESTDGHLAAAPMATRDWANSAYSASYQGQGNYEEGFNTLEGRHQISTTRWRCCRS
jgi:hypothetical protein